MVTQLRSLDDARFDSKTRRLPFCSCLLWTGSLDNGYGNFWDGSRIVLAHRFAYERANGPIPAGMNVLHECDDTRCVEPSHLVLGDQRKNLRDALHRGRLPTKLTWDRVAWIRAAYARGGWTQRKLAKRFGVSIDTISDVVHHRTWQRAVAS